MESDLRIVPNPVADRTELRYTVGSEGRVRLEVTDAAGRTIQVQDEGQRAVGTFSYGWDTTLLTPGTYYCTLYVNDEPLVKKAVKLNAR
jgi:flagellar hook assembly protein FlgD